MSNFIVLTKEQFESYLPKVVLVENPYSKEYIYEIDTKNLDVNVRIYSSVDIRTNQTRKNSKDAIRIIFWDSKNDRPIGKGKRIYRVESKTTIQERIQNRINEFFELSHDLNIIDFNYVKAILNSNTINWSGFAKSLLENLEKWGKLSDKQLAYVLGTKNPKGKDTFEATVKVKDPEFFEKYVNSQSDEEEIINETKEDKPKEVEKRNEEVSNQNENRNMVQTESVDPIPTNEYKPYQYKFKYFNPVQSMVYPYIKEDKNMVISAATSAGKTICAELIMDEILENGV